jgi:hypothetical protein
MSEAKNVDNILTQPINDNETIAPAVPVVPVVPEVKEPDSASIEAAPSSNTYGENDKAPQTNSNKVDDSPIDEYGNPVEKPRMYSEDEVQRMIRERLSRGRHAEQPTKNEVNDAARNFKPDPDSSESWEAQLEEFVEKTIEKRQSKLERERWQEDQRNIQADFEAKFNTGMNKYKDFKEVVANKPITDAMMLATRSMDDPAAFIYAASKLQPKELERIANLRDPYQQATEIGRLEEKMKRTRNAISNATKPINPVKGDMTTPMIERKSIDQLIAEHAKSKARR